MRWSREKERPLQKEHALACFSSPAARVQEQGEWTAGLPVVTCPKGQEEKIERAKYGSAWTTDPDCWPVLIQPHCPSVAIILWMTKHMASELCGTVIQPRGIRMEEHLVL